MQYAAGECKWMIQGQNGKGKNGTNCGFSRIQAGFSIRLDRDGVIKLLAYSGKNCWLASGGQSLSILSPTCLPINAPF
jgi:hypothetical protein